MISEGPPEKEKAVSGFASGAGQDEDSVSVGLVKELREFEAPLTRFEQRLTELALNSPDELGELLRVAVILRRGRRLLSDFLGGRKA